eukprot:5719258-Pleurochrysis_carterae.AAC.3
MQQPSNVDSCETEETHALAGSPLRPTHAPSTRRVKIKRGSLRKHPQHRLAACVRVARAQCACSERIRTSTARRVRQRKCMACVWVPHPLGSAACQSRVAAAASPVS